MYNNIKETYNQLEKDEFDGKINDKELLLELLNISTQPSPVQSQFQCYT